MPAPGGISGTLTGSTLNISEELSTHPVDTAPPAITIGNTKLIADQRANTIIILPTQASRTRSLFGAPMHVRRVPGFVSKSDCAM